MRTRAYGRLGSMLLTLSLYCTSAGAAEHGQDIQQNMDNLIRTNACTGCDLRGPQ